VPYLIIGISSSVTNRTRQMGPAAGGP